MIVKITIVFLAVLLASALLRRAAAATRHAILTAGQFAALLLPLLAFVVPPIEVSTADFVLDDRRLAAPPVASRPLETPTIDYMPWLWALGFAAAGSGVVRASSLRPGGEQAGSLHYTTARRPSNPVTP